MTEHYLKRHPGSKVWFGEYGGAFLPPELERPFAEMTGGELPDHVAACVGDGSNAMGIFQGFIDEHEVQLHGVEPLGRGDKDIDYIADTFGYGD